MYCSFAMLVAHYVVRFAAMENRREWASKGHEIVEKMVAKFGKGEVAAA